MDITKANKIYEEELAKNPKFNEELVMEWREQMPEEFFRKMYEKAYGCHIYDEDLYNQAVSYLVWANDKGKGAKWDVDTIVKLSDINFEDVPFYEYDYAYVVNMLWSDYCNIFTDTSYYLKMAKQYLTDPDYPGKADERAYKNAMKRIRYFEDK